MLNAPIPECMECGMRCICLDDSQSHVIGYHEVHGV